MTHIAPFSKYSRGKHQMKGMAHSKPLLYATESRPRNDVMHDV